MKGDRRNEVSTSTRLKQSRPASYYSWGTALKRKHTRSLPQPRTATNWRCQGGRGRPRGATPGRPQPAASLASGADRACSEAGSGPAEKRPLRRQPRPRSFPACCRHPRPLNSGPDLRSPSPRPRQDRPPFSPRARLALTRSMWEKPVSTRFLRSSQPMPPAPTTSTRPPATASASSRGSPRDSAMAGRPRAAAEAEARELSRGRKQVGEGRPNFRSCALRPPVGADRATPGT